MKIEIQVDLTLLNNFHLIHKGGYLIIKVPKLRSEVTDWVQKFQKSDVMNNTKSITNIK